MQHNLSISKCGGNFDIVKNCNGIINYIVIFNFNFIIVRKTTVGDQ